MEYNKLNNALGWLTFLIAMFVFGSTVEPTASFWDCGEYIATSYKLEVGHPPGAPTFMMIGRVVSMFAPTDMVALMINMISAFCSALTIMFLFWTISILGRKLMAASNFKNSSEREKQVIVFGSALVGSLAYTFSDTFWFSAVEGEVYAMSSLFTAIVFWAILKWEARADEPGSNRWLILIAYLIGLSIGIHLLNLLAIPAVAFVIYFRKYKNPTPFGMALTAIIGIVTLGVVQSVLIPQVVNLASKFEYLFVNTFNMPFNSGAYIYALLVTGAVVWGLMFTEKKQKPLLNTIILSFAVLLIGYSSFAMILIRSSADTPIDENNPENMVNLLSYLNREQYGDFPLLSGQYFNSPYDPQEPFADGNPVYYPNKKTGKYAIADERKNSVPQYAKEFTGFFPRMWSAKGNHVRAYKNWSDFKGRPIRFNGAKGPEVINKPTFMENMRFFFAYQINWMYVRYFMWNYAGRQNDKQGHGDFQNGNWMSGIPIVDSMLSNVGAQDNISIQAATNKARNHFYMLPLILGLLGFVFHAFRDGKNALVVGLLFLFTGLAIVIYLNQYPYQPRERDYAYAGSFYAFAIWIGLGVLSIYEMFKEGIRSVAVAGAVTGICLILVPGIMAKEGWDDHDRSGRYTARDIARNYLESCAPNAILFTNGDNDTFPLWYIQEVEGFRTDVRVVNLTLLSTDWFINQMKRQAYDGLPIPGILEEDMYRQGTRDYVPVFEKNKSDSYYDIKELVEYVSDDKNMALFQPDRKMNYFPTRNFSLKVDVEKVIANGTVPASMASRVLPSIDWKVSKDYIYKSELVLLDILAHNNWERPIYFANTMPKASYFGLGNYMLQEGFAYRLVPIKFNSERNPYGYLGEVSTERMYENMMTKFRYGGLENPGLYLDENNLRFVTNLRLNFSRLADKLQADGEREKSLAVLDKCMEMCANDNTPMDVTLLSVVELFYKLGEAEKGNELSNKIFENYESELGYLLSLSQEYQSKATRDIQQSQAIMQNLGQMAQQFNQNELASDYDARFKALVGSFAPPQ